MNDHDDQPRYAILTRRGFRGPFSSAQLRGLVEAGRLPLSVRVRDTRTQANVLVSEIIGREAVEIPAPVAAPSAPPDATGIPRWALYALMSLALVVMVAAVRRTAVQQQPAAAAAIAERSAPSPAATGSFADDVAPFIAANCVSCHGGKIAKGGVSFDHAVAASAEPASLALWKRAIAQLEEGSMPPQGRPRPDSRAQAAAVAWMHAQVASAGKTWTASPLRRLNRSEYANAVADLLGTRQDLRELMPDELSSSDGFTNEADLLQITSHSVEAYLKAAQAAAAEVIQPTPPQRWTLLIPDGDPLTTAPADPANPRHFPNLNAPSQCFNAIARGDLLVFYHPQTFNLGNGMVFNLRPLALPGGGTYRIRLHACAVNLRRSPVRVRVSYSDVTGLDEGAAMGVLPRIPLAEVNVPSGFADEPSIAKALAATPAVVPIDQLATVDPELAAISARALAQLPAQAKEIPRWIKDSHPVPPAVMERARASGTWVECVGRLPAGAVKLIISGEDLDPDRWLFINDAIQIEGPLPPTREEPELSSALKSQDAAAFARWLSRIMVAAFRRPVGADEAAACFKHFRDAGAGEARSFVQAASVALAAVLCSPEFITVVEKAGEEHAARPLRGSELATRLALFLWRGLPDQELTSRAAARAGLAGPALDRQVERMLGDARLGRFIHDFTEGWLGLAGFESKLIDAKMFPDAQGSHLHESLRREPDEFLARLIAEDASLLDCLACDYVLVNQRLAAYYVVKYPSERMGETDDVFRVIHRQPKGTLKLGPWSQAGPFKAATATLAYSTEFGPEKNSDPAASFENGTIKWVPHPEWEEGAVIQMLENNSAFYMTRTITAVVEEDILLSVRSQEGHRLWFDGVQVGVTNERNSIRSDPNLWPVTITPGEHRILLKVNKADNYCGFAFRVVERDFRRGGLMGMGAMLMQTSQTTRTAPVRRGVWFLENLLGIIPPPPPPNVKKNLAVLEGTSGAMSRRQALEAHRTDAVCASCHARFDPLGFALENYGPDARWRTNELLPIHDKGVFKGVTLGAAIDPSGTLSDGRTFADLESFQRLMVEEPTPFIQALARKTLAFAVGHRLGPQDDASVDGIVRATKAGGYRARTFLKAVIASDSFRMH